MHTLRYEMLLKEYVAFHLSFVHLFTSTKTLIADGIEQNPPPCLSWPLTPLADGIKWLRRPTFLFTFSDLFAVVKESLFITPSRMNCILWLNIFSYHFLL